MPRPKIVTSSQPAGAEHGDGFEHVAHAAALIAKRLHLCMIDDRHLDLEADAVDGQHQQRQADLGAQLWNLPDDATFSHIVFHRSLAAACESASQPARDGLIVNWALGDYGRHPRVGQHQLLLFLTVGSLLLPVGRTELNDRLRAWKHDHFAAGRGDLIRRPSR